MKDDPHTLLEDFNKLTDPEINLISSGSKTPKAQPESKELKDMKLKLKIVIEEIAKNGDSAHYEWKNIRNLIVIKVREALLQMQNTFPDCKSVAGESFDEQMEVILQFLCGFEEK